MKFRICVIVILIFNFNLNGQNNLSSQYRQEIRDYLAPGTTGMQGEVVFISMPADAPEYSIVLESKEGPSILKLRSFKRSYWPLFSNQVKPDNGTKYIEIDSTVSVVSKCFADKLDLFFQSVLKDDPFLNARRRPMALDDNAYWLMNNNCIREFHEYDISTNEMYRKLVTVCESIAKELKNESFNEEKYTDLLDSFLKTEIK